MPSTFSLQIQTGEVVQTLRLIEASFSDPTQLMEDVLLLMIRSTQINFEQQGRPDRWAHLSEATIARRIAKLQKSQRRRLKSDVRARYSYKKADRAKQAQIYRRLFNSRSEKYYAALGSIQILRDSGLLALSVGGRASGQFATDAGFGMADKSGALLGTNRPGSDALQLGNPEGNLPARPFLLLQPQDEQDISDLAMHWMLRTGPYAVAVQG